MHTCHPILQRQELRPSEVDSLRPHRPKAVGRPLNSAGSCPQEPLELFEGVGRLLPAIRKLHTWCVPIPEVTSGPVTVGPCRTGLPYHLVLIVQPRDLLGRGVGGGWGQGRWKAVVCSIPSLSGSSVGEGGHSSVNLGTSPGAEPHHHHPGMGTTAYKGYPDSLHNPAGVGDTLRLWSHQHSLTTWV